MQKLLSDQFELHDKALLKVMEKFKFHAKPAWQHKWFYRYLQISLSYRYVHSCECELESGSQPDEGYKEFLPDYDYVKHIWSCFSDVWTCEFIRWWAIFGQKHFSKKDISMIDEIALLRFGKKYVHSDLDLINKSYKKHLKKWLNEPSVPDMLILGVPMDQSKEQLLQRLGTVLDKYTVYPQENASHGNFYIFKSKIKEETIRDCYRTLEIKMNNPDISLIELANKSNTLKTSLAGLRNSKSGDHVNTVQVGIKRQLNMAINLAENAARGVFPCVEKGYQNPLFYLHIPLLKKLGYVAMDQNSIFDQIMEGSKYKSLDIDTLLKELPYLVQASDELNIGQVNRSY